MPPTIDRPPGWITSIRPFVIGVRHDRHAVLAVAIVIPVLLAAVLGGMTEPRAAAGPTIVFLAVQVAIGRRFPGRGSPVLNVSRLALALTYVGIVGASGSETGTPPLLTLYIPIIALGATLGLREGIVAGVVAIGAYVVPVLLDPAPDAFIRERAIALSATGLLLGVGARQTVGSLERTTQRLRVMIRQDRARARRQAAVEDVGRTLAEAGPTAGALARVMELLVERFGYSHVSIYLGDERRMRLGAQRGYRDPIPEFEPTVGVLGRIMRTREAALVADVGADPDYAPADDVVTSLVSVPLMAAGELIGVVNVEAAPPLRLGETDLATVQLVSDRLAAALGLVRERERLRRRVEKFERLTAFAQTLNATLEPQELYAVLTGSVTDVIPSDVVTLTIREPGSDEYRIVAGPGADARFVGLRVLPGQGVAGQAIASGELVAEPVGRDPLGPVDVDAPAGAVRAADGREVTASVAVPLVREGVAIGALALARTEPSAAFDQMERELLPLIASQAALALTNAQLHHVAMEASIHDPLTGLFNRRHLDASMARLSAARGRQSPLERRPLAVILFDLDHFGLFNKRYGHGVGDEVLRRFATLLQERFRASDIVARLGGEEFVVLLDGATREEASRLADEVRSRLRTVAIEGPSGEVLHATVSAGCAGLDREAVSLDGLLEIADVGLSMAKHAGRDQVVAA